MRKRKVFTLDVRGWVRSIAPANISQQWIRRYTTYPIISVQQNYQPLQKWREHESHPGGLPARWYLWFESADLKPIFYVAWQRVECKFSMADGEMIGWIIFGPAAVSNVAMTGCRERWCIPKLRRPYNFNFETMWRCHRRMLNFRGQLFWWTSVVQCCCEYRQIIWFGWQLHPVDDPFGELVVHEKRSLKQDSSRE